MLSVEGLNRPLIKNPLLLLVIPNLTFTHISISLLVGVCVLFNDMSRLLVHLTR